MTIKNLHRIYNIMASESGKLMDKPASESAGLVNKLLPSEALSGIKGDWYKFGLALVVARVLTSQSLTGLTDKVWFTASLLTLLGLAAYHLLTARVVNPEKFAQGKVKDSLDDVLKFGTMLVVARALSGKSLNDSAWMKSTAYVLAGFVAFDLGTSRLSDMVTGSDKVKMAALDAVKFGTMYTVSRYLEGESFTKEWLLESGGFTLGLVAYDLLLA